MNRRIFIAGLAAVAVAPALPPEVWWVDVGPLGLGPTLCACADYLADGRYRAAFAVDGVPHIAGCTWSRVFHTFGRPEGHLVAWLKEAPDGR